MRDWRAITIHQPWCSAIAAGAKPIENRKRRPPAALLGEWVALHAGRAYDEEAAEFMRSLGYSPPGPAEAHRGAILAVGRLAGWVEGWPLGLDWSPGLPAEEAAVALASPWFFGPVGYYFPEVRPLAEPIPLRGFQGWPRVPAELHGRLEEVIR